MIVYRDQRTRADPRHLLFQLQAASDRVGAGLPSHQLVRDLLIDTGVLESALADTIFSEADGLDPLVARLRSASLTIAHAFWHSWHDQADNTREWWHRFRISLKGIQEQPLPPKVETATPEGYAYYSLYPEMYLEAAKCCHASLGEFPAVCIGLRSIGSSLSAVVAAGLTEMGCQVESFTMRPRGDPYERRLCLDPPLTALFTSRPMATFLVIDEGPGISGSSVGGTVALLHRMGIPDERICLFPSWRTDGSHLRSPDARRIWTRHRQFTSSFEEVWLDSGRFASEFPGELRDLSAGAWRSVVYAQGVAYPAVQPQHERRKYLVRGPDEPKLKLLRFAGLGARAMARVRRAQGLADAGFTPRPERTANGFLLLPFVAGRAVVPGEADPPLIEAIAAYLAHLSRTPAEPSVSDASLREMITANVVEGLRDSALEHHVRDMPTVSWMERPVQLDARMLAHEWIRTPAGFVKVDAMDHHDDHFLPGCQDIAWDVAAAMVELRLQRAAEEHLVKRYRTLSGDHTIAQRVRLYSIAYLAFRLGYTDLAATLLDSTPDGVRFLKERRRYAALLSRRLNAWSMAASHA